MKSSKNKMSLGQIEEFENEVENLEALFSIESPRLGDIYKVLNDGEEADVFYRFVGEGKGDTGLENQYRNLGQEPEFDFIDFLKNVPTAASFGDEPNFIVVQDDGQLKKVQVAKEGPFTDIKVRSSFVGGAIEGGTNIFKAVVENLSAVSVNGMEVLITLPSGDNPGDLDINHLDTNTPDYATVSKESEVGNVLTYSIDKLKGGDKVIVTWEITYNVYGTYQGTTEVDIQDGTVINRSAAEEYSTATFTVAAKSEGTPTVDCPLIEATVNGIQVPVYQKTLSSIGMSAGTIVFSRDPLEVQFSRPVTIKSVHYASASLKSGEGDYVLVAKSGSLNEGSGPNGITIDQINTSKYTITTDPTKSEIIGALEISAGENCNSQFLLFSSKYKNDTEGALIIIESNKITNVEGAYDFSVFSEHSSQNQYKYDCYDLDEDRIYNDVVFRPNSDKKTDKLILTVVEGQTATIEIDTSPHRKLIQTNVLGNITFSYNSETGRNTIEIADTISFEDSTTIGDVTFNVISND